MFITKRIAFMNEVLYFEEDTKWTHDRSKAKKFKTKKEAIRESDRVGLYEIIVEEVK
jgi:hypothetical protein